MSFHHKIVPESPLPPAMRNRPAERLNFWLCVIFIVGYVTVGVLLSIGPDRLHQSKSMHLVEGLGVAWPLWGALYTAVAALLCHHTTRVAGYFTGATLTAFYLASYVISISSGNPGSAPGLLTGYIAVFSQISGGIRSMIVAEWRRV